MLNKDDKRRIQEEETERARARLRAERQEKATRRRNGFMWVVLIVVLLFTVPTFVAGINSARRDAQEREATEAEQARAAAFAALPKVSVTFTSDPAEAWVRLDTGVSDRTPVALELPAGQAVSYTVEAAEPYEDYDLYKPYSGTITATEEQEVSVWLERTTAEEQASQRAAAEQRRQEEEAARIQREAEIEASRPRPNLEVLEHDSVSEEYSRYVVGSVRNNTNRTYGYAQISINLYDESGAQVGSTLDNINNLAPGGTWRFKALIYEDSVRSYRIQDVTGF